MKQNTIQLISAVLLIIIAVLLSLTIIQQPKETTDKLSQESIFIGKIQAKHLYSTSPDPYISSEFYYDKILPLSDYNGSLNSYALNSNSCGVIEFIYLNAEHVKGAEQRLYSTFAISNEFCSSGNSQNKDEELVFLEKDRQEWIIKAASPIYRDSFGEEFIVNVYNNKIHNYDLTSIVQPLLEPVFYSNQSELGEFFIEKGLESGRLMIIEDKIYVKKGIYLDDLKLVLKE